MNRRRVIVLLAGVILLGGVAAVILWPREPRYQGRTLTEWLNDVGEADLHATDVSAAVEILINQTFRDTNAPKWRAASQAVNQIAPEAIPWLLKWLQADDPPVTRRIIGWLEAHPFLHLHIKSSVYRNELADVGFEMLGGHAKAAGPSLVQLASAGDWNHRYRVLSCLVETQADKGTMKRALRQMVRDSTGRDVVHAFIQNNQKRAEDAGVQKLLRELDDQRWVQSATN